MNMLVTGGTGFVGSHIVDAALEAGMAVWILTRGPAIPGKTSCLSGARYVTLGELPAFAARQSIDVLVLAAVSYGRDGETASEVLDGNVLYGLRVLEILTGAGGELPNVINLDTFFNKYGVCDYMFWYSRSKAWGLAALIEFCRERDIGFADMMLEQVYGPSDSANKFTALVFGSLAANAEKLDLTEGLQKRDFIFVTDVARAVICVALHIREAYYENVGTIEVGSGEMISLRSFVETACRLSGSATALRFGAKRMARGELTESVADIRLLSGLGWSVKVGLEEGIRRCLAALSPSYHL